MLEYRLLHIPKCDLCHQPFDEAARCPRIFKACGHTACEVCLQTLVETAEAATEPKLTCLLCPKAFALQKFSVGEFPKHFAILESIQLIHEESPCSHGDQTPQQFLCLDSACINTGCFCGMCYYTVHSKCDRKQVIQRADFARLAQIECFQGSPDAFGAACLAGLADSRVAESHKAIFRSLAGRLKEVLEVLCTNKEPPTCEEFLRRREDFFVDALSRPGNFFLQPKSYGLIQKFSTEFTESLRMGEDAASPHLTLLRAMRSLLVFTSRESEDAYLESLLANYLPRLTEVRFEFGEELLQKPDLVAEVFRAFRLAFEESGFQARLSHEIDVLKSVFAKAEKDLADVEKVVSGLSSELSTLKQGRERIFRNGWQEVKDRVFLRRSAVEGIILRYEGSLEADARANFAAPEAWDISHEDYQLWMEKVRDLPKAKEGTDGESPIDLTTVFDPETRLRMTEEERDNIRSGLQSPTSFFDSVDIGIALCGVHSCTQSITWDALLALVAELSPDTAALLKARVNPTFTFLRTEVSPFLESTGVLSRNNEDKMVWELFNSAVKIFQLDSSPLKGLQQLCEEQREKAAELHQKLEHKKLFVVELAKEKTRIQQLTSQKGELERSVNKAFTERRRVKKAPTAETTTPPPATQTPVAVRPPVAQPTPQPAPRPPQNPLEEEEIPMGADPMDAFA